MAEIKPLRGIRYAWEDLSNEELGRLVAPPYDVIGEAKQQQLYARHPANIVRLDLNQIQKGDDGEDNRYERARRHLFDWIAQGTLVVDREPMIYAHEQEFEDETGTVYRRRGYIALVKLADYEEEVVLPHERTLRGPKKDRLQLMKATECNLSQIFFLYDDEDRQVDEVLFRQVEEGQAPAVEIETDDGIVHRLWKVGEVADHRAVEAAMAERPLLIADGHHRYETALAYRDFRRQLSREADPDAPYEYVMGFFVNMHDPGLQVFPTHRVVHSVNDFSMAELIDRLSASSAFEVEVMEEFQESSLEAVRDELARRGEQGPSFLLAGQEGQKAVWVRFVGSEDESLFPKDMPAEVRRLDVAILHEGILEGQLGIDREAQREMTHLTYAKSWSDAQEALEAEDTQMVAFMNPTRVQQVNDVCLSGGRMPQKSTYFYPKILSGWVINPL